jgi:hypothetical protein
MLFCSFSLSSPVAQAASDQELREITTQQDMVVVVEKSLNKMTVFYQGKPLKSFLVCVGCKYAR